MRYFTLTILIGSVAFFPALSQPTDYAIGLRLGGSTGITARAQFSEYIVGEGLLSFRQGGFQITGLVEMQKPALTEFADGIFWYYGVGAHIGYYSGHHHYDSDRLKRHGGGLALGPDAIVGLVYWFDRLPLSVSIDYKPYIDILRFRHFFDGFDDFAISVRYVF